MSFPSLRAQLAANEQRGLRLASPLSNERKQSLGCSTGAVVQASETLDLVASRAKERPAPQSSIELIRVSPGVLVRPPFLCGLGCDLICNVCLKILAIAAFPVPTSRNSKGGYAPDYAVLPETIRIRGSQGKDSA